MRNDASAIIKVRWLPDSKMLTASRNGRVALWDAEGHLQQLLIEDETAHYRSEPF